MIATSEKLAVYQGQLHSVTLKGHQVQIGHAPCMVTQCTALHADRLPPLGADPLQCFFFNMTYCTNFEAKMIGQKIRCWEPKINEFGIWSRARDLPMLS